MTFEVAMSAALSPDVSLTYVGGGLHPGGTDWIISTSETNDWQDAVEMLLDLVDVVLSRPAGSPSTPCGRSVGPESDDQAGLGERRYLFESPPVLSLSRPSKTITSYNK
jgi:hypothetical protein